MSGRSSFRISPALSIGLLISALLLSWTLAARGVRRETRRLRGVDAALAELTALRSEIRSDEALLRQRFEGPVRSLEEVVGSDLQERVDWTPGETSDAGGGVRRLESRLEWKGLRWDQLRDLLTRLENGTPPWRVVSLNIRAEGRHLSGELRVETLERAGDGDIPR